MAIAILSSATMEGGYNSSHTLPDIDVSGADTYALAVGFNRYPSSEVTSWDIEGVAPTLLVTSENPGVSGISVVGRVINNAATTIISHTPSYKLQAMIGVGLSGVNQTTPIYNTSAPAADYSESFSVSYTGQAGNTLFVFVSTRDDRTFTPIGCTTLQEVTHSDANLGSGFVGYVTATGSSQTLGASWTGANNCNLAVVEVVATGGGGTVNGKKVKVGGTFQVAPVKYKAGGVWVTGVHKTKAGGTFVNTDY